MNAAQLNEFAKQQEAFAAEKRAKPARTESGSARAERHAVAAERYAAIARKLADRIGDQNFSCLDYKTGEEDPRAAFDNPMIADSRGTVKADLRAVLAEVADSSNHRR